MNRRNAVRSSAACIVALAFPVAADASEPGSILPGQAVIDTPGFRAAAFADLDADGVTDLLWTDGDAGRLYVHLGFDPENLQSGGITGYPVGPGPTTLAIADADGDGLQDVLVGDNLVDRVTVFLSNGDGGLSQTDSLGAPRVPRYLRVGDLNADGFPDLVVANALGTARVFIYLGVGAGRFEHASTITHTMSHGAVALHDLDSDGRLDLVLAPNSGPPLLRVYHGLGNAAFEPAVLVPIPGPVSDFEIADLDADGFDDLLIATRSPGQLDVLPGGVGRDYQTAAPIPMEGGPFALHAADVDADGLPELLVGYGVDGVDSRTLRLFHNSGQGRLGSRSALNPGPTQDATVARLGPAGDLYAVSRSDTPPRLVVNPIDRFARLRGRAAGAAASEPQLVFGGTPRSDGLSDVIYVNLATRRVGVLTAGPDGFGEPVEHALSGPLLSAAAADLNDDGLTDLALAAEGFQGLGFLRGNPDGTFTEFRSGTHARMVRLAMLDGDERPDYITARSGHSAVFVHLTTPSGVHGFDRRHTLLGQPRSFDGGDIDGDGRTDILALSFAPATQSAHLTTLLGDGTGEFVPVPPIGAPVSATDLRVADFDGDGRADAALTDVAGRAHVYTAVGGGGLQLAGSIQLPVPAGSLLAEDVTGDGQPDLVFTLPGLDAVEVHPGLGDGTFGEPQRLGAGISPTAISGYASAGRPGLLVGDAGVVGFTSRPKVGVFQDRGCPADVAPPYGVTNAHDIHAYLDAFIAQGVRADIAPPFGHWNFWDVRLFLRLFEDGCP